METLFHSLQVQVDVANRATVDDRWAQTIPGPQEATRLYLVESGSGWCEHHGERFELQPGHMYIIPPDDDFTYGCDDSMRVAYLHLQLTVLQGVDLFACLPVHYDVAPENFAAEQALFDALMAVNGRNDEAATLRRQGLVMALLSRFAQSADEADLEGRRKQLQRFRPVLTYVDQHLGEGLRLADLAALVHLEPTYFATLFSRTLGMPPMRYVQMKRVDRARGLLTADPDRPLAELAAELGYVDAFHFSRSFKAFTGQSPSAYRRQPRHVEP